MDMLVEAVPAHLRIWLAEGSLALETLLLGDREP